MNFDTKLAPAGLYRFQDVTSLRFPFQEFYHPGMGVNWDVFGTCYLCRITPKTARTAVRSKSAFSDYLNVISLCIEEGLLIR